MAFAPHPDDESLGCGSLIARLRHEGRTVHVVILTDGGASHPGHPQLPREELVHRRQAEAREALAVLAVDPACIHFWDSPDGTLHRIHPDALGRLAKQVSSLVADSQPGRVFVPCSPDGSSEHDPVLNLVVAAIRPTGLRPEIWQYPIWSWWNPSLALRRAVLPTGAHWLAGEDYHQLKRRAITCYRTQVRPMPPWSAPTLPSELAEFCLRDPEYFFLTPAAVWDNGVSHPR